MTARLSAKEGSIMRKLLINKILAAVLACALAIPCAGYETVFAASADEVDAPATVGAEQEAGEEAAEEAAQEEKQEEAAQEEKQEESAQEEKQEEPAQEEKQEEPAAEEKELKEEESAPEKADETEEAVLAEEEEVLEADLSGEGLAIKEIKKVPVSERMISVAHKGTEKEALAELPDTWNVTLSDGTKKDVKVSWKCIDDFDDSSYSSFVFRGSIDDDAAKTVDEKLLKDLTMEIIFTDASKAEEGVSVTVLSPNTLYSYLDEQQDSKSGQAFLDAYGSYADEPINASVSYEKSKTVLSKKAYKVFKGISPTPDNYLYNKLSASEKRFYNNIDQKVIRYLYYGEKCAIGEGGRPLTSFIPAASLTYDNMIKIFRIYYYDNPQAFFLSSDLLYNPAQGNIAITFFPDTMTPAKLAAKAEQIATNIKSMTTKANKQKKEFNKLKKAQSLLCKRVTYNEDYYKTSDWSKWTEGTTEYDKSIMSVFSGNLKETQSGGYAKSMTALARLLGLDAFVITVTGELPDTTNGEYEWNKIRLYGEWFCADPCGDDTDDLTGDGCIYEHFLKSDATLKKDGKHNWNTIWKNIAPNSTRDYKANKTKKYKIRYYLNGGENSKYNPSYYTARSTTITLRDPSKKGRKFKGWYTDDDFEHRIKTIKASEADDIKVYAKWALIRYKVDYKLPSGVKNPSGNPKHYNVKSGTMKLKDPVRKGYTFKGWYTNKARTKRIKKIKGSDCKDYKLYSKWELNQYKLDFRINKSVDNSANPKYYTIEDKSFALKDPTRPGYTFKGWYTDADFENRIRRIDTSKLKSYTIYAKWQLVDYKVTYKLRGGTNNRKNPSSYNLKSDRIRLADPKKSGYVFKGWYTDEACTKRIRVIKPRDMKNYTLYAKWAKKK